MNRKVWFTTLGSGHGGRAIGCQIAIEDHPVAMHKIREDEPKGRSNQ